MVLVWRDLEYSRTSPDRVAYYTFNLEFMHDHAIGQLRDQSMQSMRRRRLMLQQWSPRPVAPGCLATLKT